MISDDLLYDGEKTITHCLLPVLRKDCDEFYMNEDNFIAFRERLDYNLPFIFDMVQQKDDVLFNCVGDTKQIRVNFVLLLCEQTSQCDMFTTRKFRKQVRELCDLHFDSIVEIDLDIPFTVMNYYKSVLRENTWKRNIGSVFGFYRFCELMYQKSPIKPQDEMFILSVGLLLQNSFNQVYKILGIKILKMLMDKTFDRRELAKKNIHLVIFDSLVLQVPKLTGGTTVWECIYKCMTIGDNTWKYPQKWSYLDDVFDLLTNRFVYTKTVLETTDMMMMLAKFASIPWRRNAIISRMMDTKSLKANYAVEINELRELCVGFENEVIHRWVKRISRVIVAQSSFIFGRRTDEIVLFLNAMHICYLVTLFTVHVHGSTYVSFLNQFPLLLIDAFKKNDKLKQPILLILETLQIQAENISVHTRVLDVYQLSLAKLLKHERFQE